MSTKHFIICVILVIACLVSIEAGRFGGFRGGSVRTGGSRTSSSGSWGSRSSSSGGWNSYHSSRRVTASPSHVSNSRSYASPTRSSAVPTRSSHVATQKAVNVPTTPRYVVKTHAPVYHAPTQRITPVQNYPSQSYPTNNHGSFNSRPAYASPTRTTPRTVYNPNYGGNYNNQPSYGGGYGGRPNYYNSYNSYSPYYTPSYSKYPNFYQPVGKYKDHSVRNSVIAGLGGSALGMYLGYKLGSYTSGLNHPTGGYGYNNNPGSYNPGYNNNGGSGYGTGFPQYSVVHHYHHGEKAIPQTFEVQGNTIQQCGNMTDFCTPNTTPLCMTNGTIYCVAPISTTSNCNATSLTHLPCLNTSISVPCVNASDPNCHNGIMLNETVAIPCVSNISVYGDFTSNKLQVHTFTADNSTADTAVTGQGIKNNFCVTVIADPVKVPEKMSNYEYLWYLEDNPQEKAVVSKKTEDTFADVIKYIFY